MPETTSQPQRIQAGLVYMNGEFHEGVDLAINAKGHFIDASKVETARTVNLPDRALLPGFVNAHSHAFQRGLRGKGEHFPGEAGSFWTWREAMYDLVGSMDAIRIYELSRQAFSEMLAAGITTVGEFHYLHHDDTEHSFACDRAVLRAAADAGIRIVLLEAAYRTGGFGKSLTGGQRRFDTVSSDRFWEQVDALGELLDGPRQTLGIVAHSLRAVHIDEVIALYNEARRRHLVFHMHVEEQPQEIEDCLEFHGLTPLALLNQNVDIGPTFTAVHLTHTAEVDLDAFLEHGGNACICPLTEANLGDGLANVHRMIDRGGRVCLGTDSNARICMTEEARWLEYGQRLAMQRRGACRDADGRVASTLLEAATINGARALGLRAGRIEPGYHGDLVAIDLTTPALQGVDREHLLEALLLGTGNDAIAEVCVGGRWVNQESPAT